ncbi:hypothetical protein SAY86_008914 [Trapa natans]|uniref:Uncharacterized protein n=1 Tax=Trapa natans TaxID=22666 RepID=A0AAN7KFM4_TRANT|nr:hypothetical protein SAY86_008914 [Trapa natans]
MSGLHLVPSFMCSPDCRERQTIFIHDRIAMDMSGKHKQQIVGDPGEAEVGAEFEALTT